MERSLGNTKLDSERMKNKREIKWEKMEHLVGGRQGKADSARKDTPKKP